MMLVDSSIDLSGSAILPFRPRISNVQCNVNDASYLRSLADGATQKYSQRGNFVTSETTRTLKMKNATLSRGFIIYSIRCLKRAR